MAVHCSPGPKILLVHQVLVITIWHTPRAWPDIPCGTCSSKPDRPARAICGIKPTRGTKLGLPNGACIQAIEQIT
jgi:hypothetical protein